MASERSRFEAVTRRAFLSRTVAMGIGAAGLAACGGTSDREVFAGAGSTLAGADTSSPSSSAARAAATSAAVGTSATAAPPADSLPSGAELQIAFTFAAAAGGTGGGPGGGRGGAKNPYIAVWIEDAAGAMVQTVSLWLQQGKGEKWWPDLTRWYRQDAKRVASGGVPTAQTITGATRTAGDFSVSWDGTRYDGTAAAQGSYFVCIEAAREHGPYELIREAITLAAEPFDKALTPNGELTAAAVTYVVA
jgi:hypothetical protein